MSLQSGEANVGRVTEAFAKDGFDVVQQRRLENGAVGLLANHRTAFNHKTGRPKQALYVEGGPYEQGYLTAYLLPDSTETVATKFLDRVPVALINPEIPLWIQEMLGKIIIDYLEDYVERMLSTLPESIIAEMHGVYEGLKDQKPDTKVTQQDIHTLNLGIDGLLAIVFGLGNLWEDQGGQDRVEKKHGFRWLDKLGLKPDPHWIRPPVMCNAFCAFGNATQDGKFYFGRDFQFPTAGVFQNDALPIIYNSTDNRRSIVSITAPGLVGSMTAMNPEGVATGVDMSPGANCNLEQPGFNSILLIRHAVEQGGSAEEAVQVIREAQRGVSWIYVIGDGKRNRGAVVEAGMKVDRLNALSYPAEDLRPYLPDQATLDRLEPEGGRDGMMVRWNDYELPPEWLSYNRGLFEFKDKTYLDGMWLERSHCNAGYETNNLPAFYYFCPQRENKDDLLVVTNQCMHATMRLCSMDWWTVEVSEVYWQDIQWRYDALNALLLGRYGQLDWDSAWQTISFLSPDIGAYPDYYVHKIPMPSIEYTNKQGEKRETFEIYGATTLSNLTDCIMQAHYGYFADEPVQISLRNYVD